jgi:Na+-transporting methylmalonyl-CoA/oxaloacetate decarboxylase gamma subunit
LGAQPVEQPFIICGQIFTFLYFFLIIMLPFVRFISSIVYRSINLFSVDIMLNTSDLFDAVSISNIDYYGEYFTLLCFFTICFFIVSLLLLLSYMLGTFLNQTDNEKIAIYECGFDPINSIRYKLFNLQFFRVALLFLVFDLELLYLFP